MPRDNKVYIIGVGGGGVSSLLPEALSIVSRTEILFGGERLLSMFPSFSGQKVTIKNNLPRVTDLIRKNLGHKRMVVLASGDPNFYGIAAYLTSKLAKEVFEILPNVSPMQLAFARIKESWHDAVLTSVHSRPIEDIVELVRSSNKVGLLTDEKHTPAEIAGVLQAQGIDNCRVYVCQDLDSDRESIVATDLYSLRGMEFSPLNVMILIREHRGTKKNAPVRQLFGIPDEKFQRRLPDKGLITKQEVRAVSLSKMCLAEDSVIWDIGAGSGAVSIEASLLACKGKVLAIEKDAEAVAIIRENVQKFNRDNIEVVQSLAPDNLKTLPDPTAIFVGGSGGRMAEILQVACHRLKPSGRIVINAATLESLHSAVQGLKTNGFMVETILVNVARSKEISNLNRLEALNPVFIITGYQQGGSAGKDEG